MRKLLSEIKKEYFKTHDNPFLGKHHSPETLQKMSEAKKCKIIA
jgi:hypothetical protein